MKIKTTVNRQGQVYLPSEIRKESGMVFEKEVNLVANTKSVFIYPDGLSTKNALKSLVIIQKHLEHQLEIEDENEVTKKQIVKKYVFPDILNGEKSE